MKTIHGKLFMTIVLLVALLITLLPGCKIGAPSTDIEVNLAFTEPPILNKPVTLTETFTLREDFPSEVAENITAHIFLPDGFEKVDSDLQWKGTLTRGETKSISATVRSTRTGTFLIEANAGWLVVNPPGAGGGKTLFVTVSENGATVSDQVPTANGTLIVTASPNTSNPYITPTTVIHSPSSPLPTPTVSFSQSPSNDMSVDLVFSEPPILDKPVTLTETFTLQDDFPSEMAENITAHIYLPDGFEKVDGDLQWNGTLKRGETKSLSATVQSTRTGTFLIEANAGWLVANPPGQGGAKTIFITVSEKGATVSDQVPTANGTLTATASLLTGTASSDNVSIINSFAWAAPDPEYAKSDTYRNYAKPNDRVPNLKPIEPAQIPSIISHTSAVPINTSRSTWKC